VIILVLHHAQVQTLLLVMIVRQNVQINNNVLEVIVKVISFFFLEIKHVKQNAQQIHKDERLVMVLVFQHAQVQKMLLVMHV